MNDKPLRPISILLVEDNPADAEILTEVLGEVPDSPFRTRWVERLSTAVEALGGDDTFDVVLLDLKLPDASGLDALDRVRAASPDTAVIVMTGFADDTLACEAERRGACGYLVKGRVNGAYVKNALVAAADTTGRARATVANG